MRASGPSPRSGWRSRGRKTDNVRLLLGQANFFVEFDVCFYRSQEAFEVRPKAAASVAVRES